MKHTIKLILCLALFASCTQSKKSDKPDTLIDTLINGNHINMQIRFHDKTNELWLIVNHNNITDSTLLKSCNIDNDFRQSLYVLSETGKFRQTWITANIDRIIFVLPFHPSLGLYAYTVENGKIKFYETEDGNPIYADDAFFVKKGEGAIIACMQPRGDNEYGGQQWGFSPQEKHFVPLNNVLKNTFLTTDSLKFMESCLAILNNIETDTLQINRQKFVRVVKEGIFQCLTFPTGDTIIPYRNNYHWTDFLDIDGDGYTDIRVYVFNKAPKQCDSYLFDPQKQTFRLLENCDFDIEKLTGTPYYYSCYSHNAADMNWNSELSKIENFKLILLGYMLGYGGAERQTIYIHKMTNNNKAGQIYMGSLPYLENIPEPADKQNFVKNYWKKNYQKFK